MMKNNLKIAFLAGLIFTASFAFFPAKAHAIDFNPFNPIDPFCLFSCGDDEPNVENNTYTNSNNVTTNSNNVNSFNGSTVSTTGSGGSIYVTPTVPYNPSIVNNNTVTAPVTVSTPVYSTPVYTTPIYTNPIVYNPTPVYNYNYDNYNYNNYSTLYVSCYSTPTYANTGDTVIWRTSVSGGNGSYYYSWTGTDNLSGFGSTIARSYNYGGAKTATVTVISGNQTISRNCSNSVIVTDYGYNYNNTPVYNYNYNYPTNYYSPLSVICRSNTTFAPIGATVTWAASVTGGNTSPYSYTYSWSGTDGLYGSQSTISAYYTSPGVKYANVTVYANGQQTTVRCANGITIGAPTTNYSNNQVYQPVKAAPVKIVKKVIIEKTVIKETPAPAAPVQPVVVLTPAPVQTVTAASLFSLQAVPWGLVAILVILVLLAMVFYMMFNKKKI